MTYILATARTHYEFATAEAINAAGGFAVVPRRVDIVKHPKTGVTSPQYRPFLPNFIFVATTEEAWFAMQSKRLFSPKGILPPIRKELDIPQRVWTGFTDGKGKEHDGVQHFFARSETECQIRIEKFERGCKAARYRKGDMIRIIGADLLDGQLRDKLARFVRMDKSGKIEAIAEGITIMGKPVTVRLDPGDVGIAAE